jgi:hypothetical protein
MTMRAHIDLINEASRIGNAVQLPEIPAKYKQFKVLNRGTTSVILEMDADTVLMFTRDVIKVEYLLDHEMAEFVERYESRRNTIPGMSDLDITVLKMPKLVKLTLPNVRLVKKAVAEFTTALHKTFRYGRNAKAEKEAAVNDMLNHFSAQEDHMLAPLCRFLMNYDQGQYGFDIRLANFMETTDGKIVVLDPIAYRELIDLIEADKKRRANTNDPYGHRAW